MKNRKALIAVFLILATMLVGVGYATITGALTIENTISRHPQKFNVVFTGAKADEIVDSANDNVVPSLSIQNTKVAATETLDIANLFAVSMTISGLATIEDHVTVTFTIENKNNFDVKLTPSVSGNTLFTITGGFPDGDDQDSDLDATTIVAGGGTTTYTVTIALANEEFDTEQTEKFTITLNGESVVD